MKTKLKLSKLSNLKTTVLLLYMYNIGINIFLQCIDHTLIFI